MAGSRRNGELADSLSSVSLILLSSEALSDEFSRQERGILTWIHPLHAIGEGIVRNQTISSPSRVCDNTVRIDQSQQTYRGNRYPYP